jgi:hypothetical protein
VSLRLLLDANVPPAAAMRVSLARPDVVIQSVHTWDGGVYLGRPDDELLHGAAQAGMALGTYDRKTIPPLLASLAAAGRSHAGVVFIDHRTIAPADIGGLARAMIELWDQARQWDWRDRIAFMAASAAPA